MYTELDKINRDMNGANIIIHSLVVEVNDFQPIATKAVYDCRDCNRKKIVYPKPKQLRKPRTCTYCEGHDMVENIDESEFTDYQEIILRNIRDNTCKGRRKIKAYLLGKTISVNICEGDFITASATVRLRKSNKKLYNILELSHIQIKDVTHLKPLVKKSKHRRNGGYTESYRSWRSTVLEMDYYTCQKCNKVYGHDNSDLQAHHIVNYSSNDDLRLDPDNGITFCQTCHRRFHQLYGIFNNNRGQVEEFINCSYLY